MPACGGKAPYPRRMGGGKPRLVYLLDSLNAQRGTAYDVTENSPIYVENMAFARAFAELWSMNQRLANQWIPSRMTTCLSRWEAILGITPGASDTDTVRRERISTIFSRTGAIANRATLEVALSAALGSVFLAIEYISYANAVIHVPDGTYPWGTVATDIPWSSTVSHILIKTQKPSGYSEGEFYAAVGVIEEIMDAYVPSWVTWDWYRAPAAGVAVTVTGGPSAAGFYLDDEHNLDNAVFDV